MRRSQTFTYIPEDLPVPEWVCAVPVLNLFFEPTERNCEYKQQYLCVQPVYVCVCEPTGPNRVHDPTVWSFYVSNSYIYIYVCVCVCVCVCEPTEPNRVHDPTVWSFYVSNSCVRVCVCVCEPLYGRSTCQMHAYICVCVNQQNEKQIKQLWV
jgi:hypothetical protein